MKNFLKNIKFTQICKKREIDLENVIKKLKQKYKNQRIVIYGSGLYSKEIFEKYDLTGLNIVAVTDMKYPIGLENNLEKFYGYRTLNPNDLFYINFDVIFITIVSSYLAKETLEKIGLKYIKDFKVEVMQEQNNFVPSQSVIEFLSKDLKPKYIKRIEL